MKLVLLSLFGAGFLIQAQSNAVQSNTLASNPFSGSVPSNDLPAGSLSLSLDDTIQRGLKQNLGLVLGNQNTRLARAQELQARSALLPNLSGRVTDTEQQVNLAAFGFNFSFPGISIPTIVGPFNVFDARALVAVPLLDLQARNNSRAAGHLTRAAEFDYKESRETVVLLVASAYLQIVADEARVEEARTEVNTAQALFQKAQDLLKAGLSPAIDALRAQVELQSEQTRLRQLVNDLAKDKLGFARLIGLQLQQDFTLTEKAPYAELAPPDVSAALENALQTRPEYLSADARVRAAEASKRAAVVQRYPTLAINADYGDIGASPWNSHGTFTASVGARFSIWDGGRIRGEIDQADAELQQRKAELADLRGRIEYDVRAALLDLQTAADQVQVARSSVDLARQALVQSQDRFGAGVADNIEVVQAQNAVASASTTYINSLYAHNVAKVSLARALGVADRSLKQYVGGK